MELIAKFYPHLRSGELIDQLVITSEVNIKQEIRAFGEAEFLIPIVPGIKEDCKVELYEANSNQDRLIFRGFIYEINPVWGQFQTIKITVRGEKAILHKRKALRDYKFTNQPISAILTALLQNYNTEYGEDWGFELEKDENLTLEIGIGDDYYDIFDEICEQKELFRVVEDGVISFKKSGKDLRATQILEFDGLSPNPGNITNIELIGTATGGNVVLVEDSNGKKTIDKSQFSGFLTGVVSKQIRKGDDAEKAKQFAKEQARPQRKYQIQVANGSIEANIGDRISVEVVNTNSFYDYQGDAMVQSKVITYANASKVVQYGIEEFMVKPFNGESWVEVVEKSIKMLRQRKGGGETPPTVDLSGYATSSAVNQAIQSQNTKIDQKADSFFVAGVAQTAQTALNTANQAKQTAESKADAQHSHDDRYYTEAEIDEKLRGKADSDHTHNFPTALPASDVYDWAKQPSKPTYSIDEISGLRDALNSGGTPASLKMLEMNYTTDITNRWIKLGSRHQISGIAHGNGGYITQFLWGDLFRNPEGTGNDGGRGLEFGPHGNPYLKMQNNDTHIGRSDGHIFPKNWIEMPNHKGLFWNYNTDQAYIYFRSNNNDDTSLDFKLGDDGSERFRFLFNDTWRVAWNNRVAMFGQKMFIHRQIDGEPIISLALGDNDTGFNWNSDGNFTMKANGADLNTFYNGRAPIVWHGKNNGEIRQLTQAQYDALGAGRPDNVIYYIID